MKPQISILIPAYNQFHLTQNCLNNLFENSSQPHEIVIVDNASTDETTAGLSKFQYRFEGRGWNFKILRVDVNQGFGRAVNLAFRASSPLNYSAVLGNDTWLMPNWDIALIGAIERLDADMVGPFVDETPFDPEHTPKKVRNFLAKNAGRSRKQWESALMFFRRSSFEKIGLFDERFYLTFEDADLQERMDRANMKYFQVGDCFMWHQVKGTRGLKKDSSYEQEGFRLFMEKWGFDPCRPQHTRLGRLKRRWKKIRNSFGYL